MASSALPASALSLAEAQRRALEAAPQLAAASAAARAAREMAVAAGRRPDPVAKIGLENLPIEGPDRFDITSDFMTMRRIALMQEFTRGDKLRARSERFGREAEKNEAERQAAVAAVQRETATAWLERYYAEAMTAAIAEQRVEALREVEGAEATYRAGRGSQAEVFAARGAVVSLEDRLNDAQARIAIAQSKLSRWIGSLAQQPLTGSAPIDAIPDEFMVEHLALEHHPDVQTARRNEQMAAAEVEVARTNRQPDWTWELAYSRRSPTFSDMVSIGVSLPVPWDRANKQDREVAAKRALVEQAAAQSEELLRMHTAEVKGLVAEWRSGQIRARRLVSELVPLAEQRTQATLAAYRGGRGGLADVLVARRAELEARLQILQLQLENARLWARLNFLLPVELANKDMK